MIRKFTTLAFCAMMLTFSNAQTFDVGGMKSSNTKENLPSIKSSVVMPEFDLNAVLTANAANEANKVGPYMFGYEHQVNLDLNNSGQWDYLKNGDRIWRLRVKSDGALSLNFAFTDFYIPEGAHLHVYSADKSYVLGGYTSQNNNVNNQLGTELIKGDEGIIEYYEPKEVQGQGRLLLTMIVHGYRDINGWYTEKNLNSSGACNMDAICPDGDDWRDEIRSVARIVNGGGVCTGTLINNTSLDGTPYFLTANHCGPQNMGAYSFQFKFESPTCGSQTSSNSTNPTGSLNVVSGSSLVSRKADSDFGLLELNAIPANPYYAGWDNSGAIPQSAVGIHHPSGDVKKLAFDDDVLQSATAMGSAAQGTWQIEQWERLTTTEGGSSGSGLWDQNHRLIGQLWGGQAACGNSINDYYGKLSMSWNGNGATSSAQRLRDWLDPQNTGATTLDGYDPNAVSLDFDAALQSAGSIETICSSQFTPQVTIKNSGLTTLTSATITYNLNGGANQVYNWTGSLATNASQVVTLPSMTITGTGSNTFNATVSNPNGQTDGNAANDVIATSFSAVPNSMSMYLNLTVDCYGEEVAWEVRQQGSTTALFSGSNYPGTGTTPVANGTQITEEFCLSNGCYTFEITDTYGDGMAGAQYPGCNIDGDYNLQDYYGNTFFSMAVADYGDGITHNFCISTVGVEESVLESAIGLFPNPTASIFTVTNNGSALIEEITVLNALGAIVLIDNAIATDRHDVNISNLENGVYFVRIVTENGSVTRKVVKK